MAFVGTVVIDTEVPAASANPFSTANAFVVGVGDWGSNTQPKVCNSITDVVNAIGPRSATNSTLYDALDCAYHEGLSTAYVGRVQGSGAAAATLALSPSAALTVTAAYPGVYGNQLTVAVTNNTSTYTITLSDTFGTFTTVSPALTTLAAGVAWFATTGYATAVLSGSTLPATVAATQLTGGTNGTVALTQFQNALNTFSSNLGPGQVFAPGQTNTTLSGIWQALGAHALANNRVAIADMDDNQSAATLISDLSTTYNNLAVGPIGFWAGNQLIPGTAPLTTRTVAPSAVIAGLCARADIGGNPNRAAMGSSFPLQYVTGPVSLVSGNTETYNQNDINALNAAGINTFNNVFGVLQNYGFVSSLLPTTDAIYWQFNHERLRMALNADAQILGAQFFGAQLDGSGTVISAFNTALSGRLAQYKQLGALWAYSVDTGPDVNNATTEQNGQLNATISVQESPFAQTITITVNAVPLTSTIATQTQ